MLLKLQKAILQWHLESPPWSWAEVHCCHFNRSFLNKAQVYQSTGNDLSFLSLHFLGCRLLLSYFSWTTDITSRLRYVSVCSESITGPLTLSQSKQNKATKEVTKFCEIQDIHDQITHYEMDSSGPGSWFFNTATLCCT